MQGVAFFVYLLKGSLVPFQVTLLYALAAIVGLRAIWMGGRGLFGQVPVRFPWPLNRLASAQSVDEQDVTVRVLLRLWSMLRVFFGLVLVGLGAFGLWAGYLR